ncbi:unnamed protein product [Bursaphelenchus okinawaensis]|uniref:CX domain-containing protein n=1 Tax=Bursaphelenchus okinawaensis TaxID=465554 RepID=A0A811KJC2_9BILA|nr:unnamed protein product [Bursaphelenchus okinawaensis]CAG9105801.1 unnamed protein product [Bursaphelenchus okinawaensis]
MLLTTITTVCLLQLADAVYQCPMYGLGGLGYPYGGTYCGQESIFYYYTCCEHNIYECCFNLEAWVMYVNSALYPYGPLTSADYLSQWIAPCTASPHQQYQPSTYDYNTMCNGVDCGKNCNNDCCCCDDVDYCSMDENMGMYVGSSMLPYPTNLASLMAYPHYNQPYSTFNGYGVPYSPYLRNMMSYSPYYGQPVGNQGYMGSYFNNMVPYNYNMMRQIPQLSPMPSPQPIAPLAPVPQRPGNVIRVPLGPHTQNMVPHPNIVPLAPLNGYGPQPQPIVPLLQQPIVPNQYFSNQYYNMYKQYIQAMHHQHIRHIQKIRRCKRKCKGEAVHSAKLQTQIEEPTIHDKPTSRFIISFSVAIVILAIVGLLLCLGCCGVCLWTARPRD